MKNIERNNLYLASLFSSDADTYVSKAQKTASKKGSRKVSPAVEAPTRRSTRLLINSTLQINEEENPLVSEETSPVPVKRKFSVPDVCGDLNAYASYTFSDPVLANQNLGAADLCSSIAADYEKFMSVAMLGIPIDEYGKAAVMKMSLYPTENAKCPRFNKYSGVAEFTNCVYLWVTYAQTKGKYENKFFSDGRAMLWFGGSKMNPESRVIRRLLSADAVVLLFVRADGENYIPLGLVRALSCNIASLPISVTWELLHFERLRENKNFRRIIELSN